MSIVQRFRQWKKVFFARSDLRAIYQDVQQRHVGRLLEIGLGDASRAKQLIELATKHGQSLEYTAIDLFEMRTNEAAAGLSLKLAHRQLCQSGAKVRLIPGDPYAALAHYANSLIGQDLVLIAADQPAESLAKAWFYIPRLLASGARLFVEQSDSDGSQSHWSEVSSEQLAALHRAAQPRHSRRAA